MHPLFPRTRTAITTLVRSTVLLVLITLGIAAGATAWGAGIALADDGDASWAVRTASNDLGSDRTSYGYNVDPGGQVTDALIVINHGTTALTLGVYAADGYTTDSGQIDLLTKDVPSVGIGAWVHAASDSVTIEPGGATEVPFTVQIPDNATPGDYVGGIVTSLTQESSSEGINVDRRLGVRIALRVGGELRPALAVENLHVDYSGTLNPFGTGNATVSYTIHNVGNAVASAQQAVSVAGLFGWFRVGAGEEVTSPQLLPDEKWNVSVPVHGVAPGVRLSADVTLMPVLADASGSTASVYPVKASTGAWAMPWALLVLIIVLIVAIVGLLILRRRSQAREDARVQEAIDEAMLEREESEALGTAGRADSSARDAPEL